MKRSEPVPLQKRCLREHYRSYVWACLTGGYDPSVSYQKSTLARACSTEVKRCKAKWCSLWCPPFYWSCFRRLRGAEALDWWFVNHISIYLHYTRTYFLMFSIYYIHMCCHFFNLGLLKHSIRKSSFIPVSARVSGDAPGFSNPTAGQSPWPWSW